MLFGGVVLGLFWAGILYEFFHERAMAVANAQRHTANIAIAFREHIQRLITGIDQTMLEVRAQFQIDPDHFRLPPGLEASPLLRATVVQISVLDANGRLRQSDPVPVDGALDLSDRQHFRHHLDPPAPQPYISVPVLGRVSGKWSIQISRRLERRDGSFAGVLVFSLDPFYLSRFFETVDLGEEGVVALVGRDGIIRARGSINGRGLGEDLTPTGLLTRASGIDQGTFRTRSLVDGIDRIYSFAAIPDYPLLVTVGAGLDDVLAGPRAAQRNYLLAGCGVSVVVAVLVWLLLRTLHQRDGVQAQLRQAQKLEAVGRLTGGLAHDFNNLITTIIGNVERAEAAQDGAARQRFLRNIDRAASQGARLVHHLLAFARQQRLEPRPIDLNQVVLGLTEMLTAGVGAAIQIERRLQPGLWAMADPDQLETAILNVVFNARDAMPAGGRLIIETASYAAGDPRLPPQIEWRDYVCISIMDTGDGMSSEVLEKVFDPFFTTKEVGKGSGLGLSQVLGMANQAGGTVTIDSARGSGTTVRIFLPRAAANASATAVAPVERGDPERRSATVLVIDDDFQVREFIGTALGDYGYRVLEAKDGTEALEHLAMTQVDLAVVDMAMPGMTGIEFVTRARAMRSDLAVLFMTAHAESARARAIANAPLLTKPFKSAAMLHAVTETLRRAQQIDASSAPAG